MIITIARQCGCDGDQVSDVHGALAGELRRFRGHAPAVLVGIDGGQVLEDGQVPKAELARDGHGEEEVAALAAGDEIDVHRAGGVAQQVDELRVDGAGVKLLRDAGPHGVVEGESVARARRLNDGEQLVGGRLAAEEELSIDVERAELAGGIPEGLSLRADAHGVGFKQPGDDRIIHGKSPPYEFFQPLIIRYFPPKGKPGGAILCFLAQWSGLTGNRGRVIMKNGSGVLPGLSGLNL